MIRREKIFYELVGEEGLINQALKKQQEGKKVDIDGSYRIGASCYLLVWHESEESVEPEAVKQVEDKPEEPESKVDYKYLDSLKSLEAVEAKGKLIKYAVSLGIPADKFDKRKSLDKLRKTFAGIISQKK